MRQSLIIGATAALLAGCAGLQPPTRSSDTVPAVGAPATTSTYQVLHRFGGILKERGGTDPGNGLLAMHETLYGTTVKGGKLRLRDGFQHCAGGAKKLLYSFGTTGNDGLGPSSELIALNGSFTA